MSSGNSGSITILGIIAASVGVTAGLLWNDAIQTSIARFFPNQVASNSQSGTTVGKPSYGAIVTKFLFAFVFTVLLVLFVIWIGRIIDRFLPHLRKLKAEY
jgi:hypothetical protein